MLVTWPLIRHRENSLQVLTVHGSHENRHCELRTGPGVPFLCALCVCCVHLNDLHGRSRYATDGLPDGASRNNLPIAQQSIYGARRPTALSVDRLVC